MAQYVVTLTDIEDMALTYETHDPQDWIDNASHNRCRIAIEDIAKIAIEKCFEQNIPVPATKELTVRLAFDQGWVKTVSERINDLQLPPT